MSVATREITPTLGYGATLLLAALWVIPFVWMLVAAFNPQTYGGAAMASLLPSYVPTLNNFAEAWASADFPRYTLNTAIISLGTLAVQIVTITLAGYAFARIEFPGRTFVFYLFLLQLMLAPVALIIPNLVTIASLGLYDTLLGVMAPYFASAFGTFLMRQAFKAIPRELEDAALIDGASIWQRIGYIYLPLAKPSLIAFSIISLTSHWNEFLWPLMVINSPDLRPLTVGLATFTRGAEGAQAWGVIAAGTLMVSAPLLIAFALFQRSFVNSFVSSGIK
ncbi:carbohydrate ABC transporter permease [Bosea sp. BK604]|uniref:carbohydrate ABC transporter permease n=1 Tax=Bosea sp. BK604 TaxID=2512180 RepID=UPI001052F137|nr:carbohydrate ABC transporter permease [Bosea sp. BK604]TCR67479.1 carbohydrate ABC transporter membrane protein 2 (CUT1 family) [Bosea sp. BK604]